MRAMRTVALSLALALGFAASLLAPEASAADLGKPGRGRIATIDPAPIPPDVSPFTWTGLYVGAHAGYGWSDIDWQEATGFSGSHTGEGLFAGGQVGFNLQAGRLVYGIEADVSAGWIEGGEGGCCSHSVDLLYSVRGRLGLTSYDGRWLFYATGGGAGVDIQYRGAGSGSHSDTHFGWVAGGGVERALTPKLTARVEYLYYDFDGITAPAGSLSGAATDLDPSMHTVRFGLNLKF